MNVLFICSRNQWRSRTAEQIYNHSPEHHVKSAGTSSSARIVVNEKHVIWADVIFVMEKKHKQLLLKRFQEESLQNKIFILEIEDNYQFMDEELIEIIKASVDPYLENG